MGWRGTGLGLFLCPAQLYMLIHTYSCLWCGLYARHHYALALACSPFAMFRAAHFIVFKSHKNVNCLSCFSATAPTDGQMALNKLYCGHKVAAPCLPHSERYSHVHVHVPAEKKIVIQIICGCKKGNLTCLSHATCKVLKSVHFLLKFC